MQIGTWSRWLEDQFEEREDKSGGNKVEDRNTNEKLESENFRLFHLLNSLGDLMMLPFKMLADKSTRKEVTRLRKSLFLLQDTGRELILLLLDHVLRFVQRLVHQ